MLQCMHRKTNESTLNQTVNLPAQQTCQLQHLIIYSLMVVWFEAFHIEITSLSAEKYETQGADKVH